MKRVLVTGASGLLGLNFCTFFCRKYQLIGITNRTKLYGVPFQTVACDLLREDPGEMLDQFRPDVVLHCAALANIDECEKFPEKAAAINSIYPGRLAAAARKRGIKFVHISTDAVFDGEDCGESGYKENDAPNPVSRYAETKLQGEINVLDSDPEALVPRVNFYGWSTGGSRSLVEFFYNNLAAGNQVNGFCDVFFNTLYVHSLADILDEMMPEDKENPIVYVEDRETSWNFYIEDLRQAKKRIHVDIPDVIDDNDEAIEELVCVLSEKKKEKVEVCIRLSEDIDLPEGLQEYAESFEYVTNPITLIDQRIVWFGQPLYASDFISEGEILDTEYFPCVRFSGMHTARMIQALLEIKLGRGENN